MLKSYIQWTIAFFAVNAIYWGLIGILEPKINLEKQHAIAICFGIIDIVSAIFGVVALNKKPTAEK